MAWLMLRIIYAAILFAFTDGSCTFPSTLTGVWYSSDLGKVTFTSQAFTTTSSVENFGALTFSCKEKTGSQYLVVSNTFTYLGTPFKLAICWDFFQENTDKIIYNNALNKLANTTHSRVLLKGSTYTFTSSVDCKFSNSYDVLVRRALVRKGAPSTVSETCPSSLIGKSTYAFDAGSGNTCTGGSGLDICTSKTTMQFNYTQCSTEQGYSEEGKLYCIHSTYANNAYYLIAYNADSNEPDHSSRHSFTCYVIGSKNGSVVMMSQSPMFCKEAQTPTAVSSPGAILKLTIIDACEGSAANQETKTTKPVENLLSAGSVIAVILVFFIVALGVVIVLTIWFYKKSQQKKIGPAKPKPKRKKKFERVQSALTTSGVFYPLMPFPTLSELALNRFGPTSARDEEGVVLSPRTPGELHEDFLPDNSAS